MFFSYLLLFSDYLKAKLDITNAVKCTIESNSDESANKSDERPFPSKDWYEWQLLLRYSTP
ncbi:MAG: hypothetical protein ACI837_000239 [Crocinitomicaceae bacterium]|jgi:hypothetical protein